jgi:hypothetical protein
MLAQLNYFTALQSIRVDTSTTASSGCMGCSVSLRLTPPQRPCFQAVTVVTDNNIKNTPMSLTNTSSVDVLLRFSMAVSVNPSSTLTLQFGQASFNAAYYSGNGTMGITYRAVFGRKYQGTYPITVEPTSFQQTLQTMRSSSGLNLAPVVEQTLAPVTVCSSCAFNCSGLFSSIHGFKIIVTQHQK